MAYVPRLTSPSYTDKRWIQVESGGFNQCIYGYYGAPSVLPNCTGYVHGRVMELRGVNTDNAGLSFGNAGEYYNGSSAIWTHSQDPELGAVMCWSGGAGHVAIVEQIIDSNTLILSESSWSGPPVRFRTLQVYRSLGWRAIPESLVFQGFLINPYLTPEPPEPPPPPEPPEPPAPTGPVNPAILLLLLNRAAKKNKKEVKDVIKRNTLLL